MPDLNLLAARDGFARRWQPRIGGALNSVKPGVLLLVFEVRRPKHGGFSSIPTMIVLVWFSIVLEPRVSSQHFFLIRQNSTRVTWACRLNPEKCGQLPEERL